MRGRFKIPSLTIPFVALASLPALASAQSLNTWSLPESDKTSAPKAEGPVDAQNPVVRPAEPEARPAPAPVPIITPLPVPPASATPASAEQIPASPTPAPGTSSRPRAGGAPEAASPAPSPSAAAALPEPAPSQAPAPIEPSAVPDESAAAPAPAAETGWPTWWWAIPAAVAVIAAGLLRSRRRRPEALEWEETPERQPSDHADRPVPAPEPEAAPARPPARPLPAPAFSPTSRGPAAVQDDISLVLEPVTMRLSLFYATLQYRIRIRATSSCPALRLSGDLISAHASLTREAQLAPQPDSLPALHRLPGLAAGDEAELKGEMQIPLPAIRALRRGGGAFFVPLARFCLVAEDGTALRRVFTVGIPRDGAGLAPLRIDAGPRNFEPLAASEIEAARLLPLQAGSLPLDPQRAAG
ncbi:MAG TPA: hypothetical protein VJQ77_11200 [Novosphingobium sp.]|nr:hypothetical protein [Novosphingobium sp.]